VGLDDYAPNRHDTGSTTARSVDEVALIRNTISHYAPMLIALLSIPRVPLRGMNFFWITGRRFNDIIRNRFGWDAAGYGSVVLGPSWSVPDEFRELAEKDL
jgi:hypothetical protein